MAETNALVLERTLDAPRDLVWKALTTAEHLKNAGRPAPIRRPSARSSFARAEFSSPG